jgi:cysteinyl-tRNA synthetase
MIQIYNSLTKTKQPLIPMVDQKIGLYVCGMTVYDLCHIGHGRVFLVFDMVVRFLRHQGYQVHYVRNITDIDDKIIARAQKNHENYQDLVDRMIIAMNQDLNALNVLPADQEPRATEHMVQIIALIQTLLEKGFAYVSDSGDVYYSVRRFADYGMLAHQQISEMRLGARVAVDPGKQDPLDFVLWKLAKQDEPFWESPWGHGRPGWHIECSAMAMQYLGEQFDIHGGGFDLRFPHHQNEIAQSQAATGKHFVNTWMHVGFVRIEQEKMSKSLGNTVSLRAALQQYPVQVLRYFLLSSHYRSPTNYSYTALVHAQNAIIRLYTSLRGLDVDTNYSERLSDQACAYERSFIDALSDDFNTPLAFSVLFHLTRDINRARELQDLNTARGLAYVLRKSGGILGLLQEDPEAFLQAQIQESDRFSIERLIQERQNARAIKDWQQADAIRQHLIDLGVVIEDTEQGTTWRRA